MTWLQTQRESCLAREPMLKSTCCHLFTLLMNPLVEYPVKCVVNAALSPSFILHQHWLAVTYSWFSRLLLCYYDSVGWLVDLFGMVISVGMKSDMEKHIPPLEHVMWDYSSDSILPQLRQHATLDLLASDCSCWDNGTYFSFF